MAIQKIILLRRIHYSHYNVCVNPMYLTGPLIQIEAHTVINVLLGN